MINRAVFANNLRRACLRFRTIAEVCEGIGINRQQFNKYLSGAAMPNAATLERICAFLKVGQSELFGSPGQSQNSHFPSDDALFGFLAPKDRDFDLRVNELPAGNYLVYTPFDRIPGMLISSLLTIKQTESCKNFVRVTKFTKYPSRSKPFAGGRHSGTVFASENEIYFLGRNRYAPRQLSLTMLDKTQLASNHCFTGLMMTQTVGGIAALKCCVLFVGNTMGIRALMNKVGLVHESDPIIDPLVWSFLK